MPSTSFIPPRFFLLVRRTIILRIESAFRVNPFTWKLFLTNEPRFSLFLRTTAGNRSGISLKRSGKAANKGRSWDERTRENARARALQRTRERAAKNRPLRRREACVATVSNRVLARKLERRQTKKLEGRGGGEKRKVSFSPLHLPVHSSFLLSSQRSRRSRAETLATRRLERSDSPKCWLVMPFK